MMVYVEWLDANGITQNWTPFSELSQVRPALCRSVGKVLRQTKKYIIIVPHWFAEGADHDQQGCGEMVIPRSQIRQLRKLTKGSLVA